MSEGRADFEDGDGQPWAHPRPGLVGLRVTDEALALEPAFPTALPARVPPLRRANRRRGLRRALVLADLAAAVLASAFCAAVTRAPLEEAMLIANVLVAGLPLTCWALGLYRVADPARWASGVGDLGRLVVAALALSWPLHAALVWQQQPHPTINALLAAATAGVAAGFGRAAARAAVHRRAPTMERAVVIGSGTVAARLADKLRLHTEFGITPIGFVDNSVHGRVGLPHLGPISQLEEVLAEHDVDRAIIAFSQAHHSEVLAAVRACRQASVPVIVVPRLFELFESSTTVSYVGGLPLLTVGPKPLTSHAAVVKRLFDVVVSLAALILAAPLFAAVALAVKVESPGPVFFRQRRVGRQGRPFDLLKFRSMRNGAEAEKAELLGSNDLDDGVMFKMHADPRITSCGRLLRRYSLDELPQLINVLKGQMSLVGPRPIIVPEARALGSWQLHRLDLRPGLTGPWQVSGRSWVPFEEMVTLDYQYVTSWSLLRDVEILLQTVPAVMKGRGAY